jgi:hypothetical protein
VPGVGGWGLAVNQQGELYVVSTWNRQNRVVTTPGFGDRYLADRIFGFPAASAVLTAYTGEFSSIPRK